MSDSNNEFDIAIIGMAGRFPDADNVQEFWSNIEKGHVSLTRFSDSELVESGVTKDQVADEDYVKAAPVLNNAARFDEKFFNYSPKEAEYIDPQQRQLLETAWHALEDAGYDPCRFDGRIATFAGTAMNTYLLATGLDQEFFNNYLPTLLGSDKDYAATRIAFKLGIRGPAVTVQSACSTSLVALHMACQSLLNQETDMALVGAAAVRCPLRIGHMYEVGSVFSKDGLCRPFDANANGTVFGSGVGVIALKRYGDAINDNDNILAVVKGSAINNDGSTKSDFTAPSINQQAEAVADALASADVDARSISYVEAHGTGTFLGDPIEVEALSRAFRLDTTDTEFCGLGSVKSNIGHLDAAAGIASIIKVVKAMEAGIIPATANFSEPNPQIEFTQSPFSLVEKNRPWKAGKGEKLRAGISSLGMGGTNAHVVLEQHLRESSNSRTRDDELVIIPLSAVTDSAVVNIADKLAEKLVSAPECKLVDVAYTLQFGRKSMEKRRAFVASSIDNAVEILGTRRPPSWIGKSNKPRNRDVIMMFPGQGSQHIGMARNLAIKEGPFKEIITRADAICEPLLDYSVSGFLNKVDESPLVDLINETALTQPVLYAVEYAYATLLHSFGVQASAYVGHSIGEYVAAALAGVFSFEDGLRLVIERGRLMQNAPRGVMMSVPMSLLEMNEVLPDSLDIAVINSSVACVVSGEQNAIAEFQSQLLDRGYEAQVLRTSHAFHSRSMDDAAIAFEKFAQSVKFSAPGIPFVSNVSGEYITDEEALSPLYWASQIRSTVKFDKCIETLLSRQASIFVEAGPGTTLTSLVSGHEKLGEHISVSMGQHPRMSECEYVVLLRGLALMWTEGYDLDWAKIQTGGGKRISLPGYPFEGSRHWYSGAKRSSIDVLDAAAETSVRLPKKQWFWKEGWCHVDNEYERSSKIDKIVVLHERERPSELLRLLKEKKYNIQTAQIQTDNRESLDYAQLFSADEKTHVVYLADTEVKGRDAEIYFDFVCLVLRALDNGDGVVSFDIITNNALSPLNIGYVNAEAAAFAGLVRVLNNEFSHISFRLIDITPADLSNSVDSLVERITLSSNYSILGFLHGEWWAQVPENISIPLECTTESCFRGKHVAIIGGFGGIGKELARNLAKYTSSLLLGATSFPDEKNWSDIIDLDQDKDTISRIQYVYELRRDCTDVVVVPTNISKNGGCKNLLSAIDSKPGAQVDYVFHLAGTIEDALVALKARDSFSRVLAPKVSGTRRLARAISSKVSEKFIVFSSTATWLGPIGQCDYATANTFQMAIAKELTDEGIPTVSIAWPGWENTGMLARVAATVGKSSTVNADIALSLIPSLVSVNAGSAITVSPCSLPAINFQKSEADESGANVDQNGNNSSSQDEEKPTSIKDIVTMIWSDALGVADIQEDDNYFNLGGNSLSLTQVVSKLRKQYQIKLDLKDALSNPVLGYWLKSLEKSGVDDNHQQISSDKVDQSFEMPTTPGIARYIKRRGAGQLFQWNLATMLESLEDVNDEILQASFLALINHHSMLRGGFSVDSANNFKMRVGNLATVAPLEFLDFENVNDADLVHEIEKTALKMQSSLQPENCELFKAILYKCGPGRPDRLLLLTHHFISDGLSWTLTLTEFQKIYRQLMAGKEIELLQPETSYVTWAEQLVKRSSEKTYLQHVEYWINQDWTSIRSLVETNYDSEQNINSTANEKCFKLSRSETRELERFDSTAKLDELAMIALSSAVCGWRGGNAALLDVVGNGRELSDEVDVTQTVGYFISYTPVIVQVSDLSELGLHFNESLNKIREMLSFGLRHDLLRYVTGNNEVAIRMDTIVPESQILFNYIGRLKENIGDIADQQYWTVAKEQCGALHNPYARRDQPLALLIEIIDGCLNTTLVYSSKLHSEEDVEKLLKLFQESLQLLSKSVASHNEC